ncbi:hypothetical protein ACHWQZ_G005699 [Mnemiopsis leidyi]
MALITALIKLGSMSDNYGNYSPRREIYSVNLGTGDIKYIPTKDQAPTEVEAIIASKSKEGAKRQLDRDFDTNYLNSHEAHLFRKRL